MKKILAFTLSILIVATAFVGCGNTDSENEISDSTNISEVSEVTTEIVTTEETTETTTEESIAEITTESTTEEEPIEPEEIFVEEYSIISVVGAEITEFDELTGACKYKNRCETCGWIGSLTYSLGSRILGRTGYTGSTVCGNNHCTMWGKSQDLEIQFEGTGHYE